MFDLKTASLSAPLQTCKLFTAFFISEPQKQKLSSFLGLKGI